MNALTENKKNQNKDIYDWEKHCKLARRLITGLYTYNPKGPDKCLKEKAPDKYHEAIRREIEEYIQARIDYYEKLLDVTSITSSDHPIPWAEYLKLFSHVNESLNVTALQTILYHDVVTSIFENVGLEFGFFLYWHKPQGASQKIEAKWLHHLNLKNNIALPEKGLFWYSLLERILGDMENGWAQVERIFEEIWVDHKVPDETSDLKKCSIPGDIVNDVGYRMQAAFSSRQMQFNAEVEKNPLINIAWEILCRELVSTYVLKQFEGSQYLFTEVEDIDIVRHLDNLDKRTSFEEAHAWLIIEHGELYFGIFQERMNKQYKLAKFEKSIDELGLESQRKLFLNVDLIDKNNALTPTGKRVLRWLKKVCKHNYYRKQREWLLSGPLKDDGQKHLLGYGLEKDQINGFYKYICEIQRANWEKNYRIIPKKFAGLFGILFSNFDGKPLEPNQLIKRLAFEPRLWDILLLNDPVRLEPEKNKHIHPSALIFFVDPLLGDRAAVAVSMIELPDDFVYASAGKLNEVQQAWDNRLECVTSIIHMIGQKCIRQQMEKEIREETEKTTREQESADTMAYMAHSLKASSFVLKTAIPILFPNAGDKLLLPGEQCNQIFNTVRLFEIKREGDKGKRDILKEARAITCAELFGLWNQQDNLIRKYAEYSEKEYHHSINNKRATLMSADVDWYLIKEIPCPFASSDAERSQLEQREMCVNVDISNIVFGEILLNAYRRLPIAIPPDSSWLKPQYLLTSRWHYDGKNFILDIVQRYEKSEETGMFIQRLNEISAGKRIGDTTTRRGLKMNYEFITEYLGWKMSWQIENEKAVCLRFCIPLKN